MLLLAVYALQQRRVPVRLYSNGLAVAESEHVGVLAGLATSCHLGDGDNGVALGDEAVELDRQTFSASRPKCSVTSALREGLSSAPPVGPPNPGAGLGTRFPQS